MYRWLRFVALVVFARLVATVVFGWNFWESVYATLVAALILGAFGWLAQQLWRRRAARLLPSQVSLVFDDSSAQFRRMETVAASPEVRKVRTVYVLGVLNTSGTTLQGVQCFVLGVDEYAGLQERRPLRPVGLPPHAERLDVPPSTNNQPSAYFAFVEDVTDTGTAEDGWAFLCVPFGESLLPFVAHINISLEGEGFVCEARFQVSKRKPGHFNDEQEWNEVEILPLTVTKLP